jgi:predicted HTH domain antitoxin
MLNDLMEKTEYDQVIISVDNLDRCESDTVYDVLVSLKTFMGNDRCLYVIPCDDEALLSHIQSIDRGEYFEENENARIAAAVSLYEDEKITLGTAARLADINRFEMRDILRQEGVELRLGPEDMAAARDEIDAARDIE